MQRQNRTHSGHRARNVEAVEEARRASVEAVEEARRASVEDGDAAGLGHRLPPLLPALDEGKEDEV